MKNYKKYTRSYFMPEKSTMKWCQKEYITKAPIWCSVDLRDGNQALIVPMSLQEKIDFFKMLVKVGFKEIEIGFPAASSTEYTFLRTLIEQNLIPNDVTIQVLTQAREHIIEKTFEALVGAKRVVVHLYNSTSVAQREQVFKKSRAEIIQLAVDGAKMIQKFANSSTSGTDFIFEYSPESFTGTEPDFALEICNAVIQIWQPTIEKKVIINLPVTVSVSMPHIYASQIEYMCDNLKERENIIVSLHPHNDRGCAIADSELGLLAGADRIEGTLFGNGERTGNVDIIVLAMNMFTHGVDPELDFSNIPEIAAIYENTTRMHVYARQPYSGQLVFAAFSGSHQDAIAKGMHWHEDKKDGGMWTVPYLPIDPKDIGREYESDVIRINSQSGKGGIGYLLEQKYGFNLPKDMREDLGYAVKDISDSLHKELNAEDILDIFTKNYINITTKLTLSSFNCTEVEGLSATVSVIYEGKKLTATQKGNGRLDAIINALNLCLTTNFNIIMFNEHALSVGSTSQAVAYVGITDRKATSTVSWGAGIDNDIMQASVTALISAINRYL